ncbi:Membrane protein involved in the export of O-antigen and teichoic acid [Paenibacillus catalpae]|uniref:Membrane protein involved in the export of O-antigen and teichoic acid n=1 Tax=Paenibacillus catalpae TaxID=1045775 RepID=A0A1I2DYM8_9BACL|nr:oligosaccharide flippase family protein [Paenibacillus catalpae]SFE85479.1 Membrane protein involved in the export of O-antigen and teichoic acid [Paenibacillus catalpae]
MNNSGKEDGATGSGSIRTLITSRLSRGGGASFLINSIGMGLAMLLQIALARLLGVEDYGIYAFVTTVVTFMVFPAKLGFDTTTVKLVSAYRVKGDWPLIKGLLRRSNQIGLTLSVITALIGIAVVAWMDWGRGEQGGTAEHAKTIAYIAGFASIPLLTLATLRQSALQAMKDALFAQMPEKIIRPVLTIGFVAALGAAGVELGAAMALLCYLVATAVTYVIGAVVLKKRIGSQTAGVVPSFETRGWLRLSSSLMVNAGMYLILGQLNVLMMGFMRGETESGLFSAAVRLAVLVSFMLTAVNMTASPLVSEKYAKGDMAGLQRVCMRTGRIGFAFAAVVFAYFVVLGHWTLGLFGPEFTQAYPSLLILAFGQLFSAYCGQNGTVATMTGRQNALTKILIAAAVVNAALNALLIPQLGMLGGALAATISIIVWNSAAVLLVSKRPGIQTLAWAPRLALVRKRGNYS